ncbi:MULTISPECIES: hypothetical protein [unclassified Rhizobium]|uniref:hypothetical protein n=1 Tax=unclassified Rhizobium TaxID=2613769 RepID=UPI000EA9E09A|nr:MULTISPECIES: hypothetical protein [unclassified Rhizobium]AYG70917.1 hypothetical protein CCGE531_33555 [Rhizobium sp. CCGE531]AYG77228.1 hypothetical protein CCGE532_32710 [Rhizobium sp. CCGE532]
MTNVAEKGKGPVQAFASSLDREAMHRDQDWADHAAHASVEGRTAQERPNVRRGSPSYDQID